MTAMRPFFRILLALLTASMLATTTHAADSAWTLDRLMSMLAHNKPGRATFMETKTLSIAAQPVELSGELVSVAPDHLEKHTLTPKSEYLAIDGDKLTVERNQCKFTMSLSQYSELGAFIESIRATLADNRYTLEAIYKVAIAGHDDDWTPTLSPIGMRMQQVVRTITLEDTHDASRSVATRQADGDHSLMRLRRMLGN